MDSFSIENQVQEEQVDEKINIFEDKELNFTTSMWHNA